MFPSFSSSAREKVGEAAEMAVGWGADKAKAVESTSPEDAAADQAEGLIFFPCSGGPHHSS